MGKESENKAGRILSIYTKLKQGKVIYKQEESNRYGVAARTIQRDITDMQCFLQEQASLSGEIQEIVYDKKVGGYVLQTKKKTQLDEKYMGVYFNWMEDQNVDDMKAPQTPESWEIHERAMKWQKEHPNKNYHDDMKNMEEK